MYLLPHIRTSKLKKMFSLLLCAWDIVRGVYMISKIKMSTLNGCTCTFIINDACILFLLFIYSSSRHLYAHRYDNGIFLHMQYLYRVLKCYNKAQIFRNKNYTLNLIAIDTYEHICYYMSIIYVLMYVCFFFF